MLFANLGGNIYFFVNFFTSYFSSLSVLDICSLQVETILDKENFTLEELLDEDEIIQECKALNGRLIN
ncbi:hypothetical protein I3843_10G083000 [Carya illinoinensis]|nr:hypothetical protein I3843_10G083000 [Carya illinoinensis]